jgi:hypothetical protein
MHGSLQDENYMQKIILTTKEKLGNRGEIRYKAFESDLAGLFYHPFL